MDIAMKLSRMLGTTVNYWLNLQNAYDVLIAEFKSQKSWKRREKYLSILIIVFQGKFRAARFTKKER